MNQPTNEALEPLFEMTNQPVHGIILTFSSEVSVLIFKALLIPKEPTGAKAIAGAAKKREASASFILIR